MAVCIERFFIESLTDDTMKVVLYDIKIHEAIDIIDVTQKHQRISW